MKKIYSKPEIEVIAAPQLCDGVTYSKNDQDKNEAKGHHSFTEEDDDEQPSNTQKVGYSAWDHEL